MNSIFPCLQDLQSGLIELFRELSAQHEHLSFAEGSGKACVSVLQGVLLTFFSSHLFALLFSHTPSESWLSLLLAIAISQC